MTIGMDEVSPGLARDILINALIQFFGSSAEDARLISDLGSYVERQLLEGKSEDEINIGIRQTDAWKQRFAGNEALRKAGLAELTPDEYLQQEKTYSQILTSAGLGDLAKRDKFAEMIGGNVSPVELERRVTNVYNKIRFADDALSKELQALKSNATVTDSDLAASLLLGKEGTDMLMRKITMAEIKAEATTRGLDSALGYEELANLGVDRRQAQQGFEAVRQASQPLTSLASMYGESTEGLQAELEREAFTGLQSERRKKLARQELSAFSGQSGSASVSLERRTQGQI